MNNAGKKKKISFNIIDVLLIVIALVAASVLIFFFNNRNIVKPKGNESVQIEYTISVSPVREEYINLIKIGDNVINTSVMESCGEVLNVTNSDYIHIGTDTSTGNSVSTPVSGFKTMIIKIKATAVKTEHGYTVNGCDIVLGKDITFRVPDYTGTGKCISISESRK